MILNKRSIVKYKGYIGIYLYAPYAINNIFILILVYLFGYTSNINQLCTSIGN